MPERPQRNLSLELVRATEAAAIVAARYRDRGEWASANAAAARAMRLVLQSIDMDGVVRVGEGEKNTAPALHYGEIVGTGRPPAVDLAVDPIEGTPTRALGRPNTLALAALAERWGLWDPGPSLYVEEIVVGPIAREAIDLRLNITENLSRVAEALRCRVRDLTVFVLDKPRHTLLIRDIQAAGARVKLNSGGFVVGALMAALPDSDVDVMVSIGKASESVIAAAAVQAVGGGLQLRRAPQSEAERSRVASLGAQAEAVLSEGDLIKSSDVFFAATGLTDGGLLPGVKFRRESTTTDSLILRARTGTVRYIHTIHRLDKVMAFSQIDYTGEEQP